MSKKKMKFIINIVGHSVNYFNGEKIYIETKHSEDLSKGEKVTFFNKPSRANLETKDTDILIAKMKNSEKILIINKITEDNIYSTGFIAINSDILDNKYLYYLLSCPEFIDYKNANSYGTTQEAINELRLKNIAINYVDDYDKQQQIANYLDKKTEEIDNTINKTKQVIEEYKKYKQSLITETVTKGLNLNVKVKDSGIEWIKKTPEKWEINKIKYIIKVYPKSNFQANEGIENGLFPFYTSSNQLTKSINEAIYNGNSIIMGTGGTASVNYSNINFSTSTDCYVFTAKDKTKYIYYCLLCNLEFINDMGFRGTGLKHLNKTFLNNLKMCLPPKQEQQQIADYLDDKCSKIDKLIENKTKLINELERYKKSLIYECVTGKRDVI